MTDIRSAPLEVHLTAMDSGKLLAPYAKIPAGDRSPSPEAVVFIDPSRTFQEIEGFGGAFTEAAAVTWAKMGEENRKRIIEAYFCPGSGHGYSLCRTHINSCDFSLGNYACAEVDGDVELKHFSLARDEQALLPMIKAALAVSKTPFKLFASPWSPPAWMKTTGMMNKGGQLRPEYREAWANYFVRYIEEYAARGVAIWGVTVQNEPAATQTWDSCLYTAGEEKDFVRDHLGPAFEKSGHGNIKIMIWDHNRDFMVQRAAAAFSDPAAAKFIWGTAFHWYVEDCFHNVQLLHDAWPDKKLLFSEGCQEGGPHTGEWELGERYARSIINDLNRWAVGWVDWNILLDETGGPNHVGNLCSAPILADTKNDRLIFQSSYYYIGHFARFIRPGARRILCSTSRDRLEATACGNPDGSVAIVVMNRTEKPQDFEIQTLRDGWPGSLPPRSIATYILQSHR
jgi:glucosylceramidase